MNLVNAIHLLIGFFIGIATASVIFFAVFKLREARISKQLSAVGPGHEEWSHPDTPTDVKNYYELQEKGQLAKGLSRLLIVVYFASFAVAIVLKEVARHYQG